MEQFEIIIDNQKVKVNSNQTILEAAKSIGINIPTLCFLKDINEPASCRVCVVEVEGARNLVTSCNTKVRPKKGCRRNFEVGIEGSKCYN